MKTNFPDLSATLVQHTIDTPAGIVGGYLVRCTASRRDLGYIWTANGSAWRWRTPSGGNFGERSSQFAAVRTLREAFNLANGVTADRAPRLPFDGTPAPTDADILSAWRTADAYRTPNVRRHSAPSVATKAPTEAPTAPPAPARRVVWNDDAPAFDVTAAIKAGLNKGGK